MLIIWLIGRWIKFSLTKMAVWILVGGAVVLKLIPLPILQVSGGELPVENVFAQRFKEYYQLNLAEQKDKKRTFIIQNKGCIILHTLES